MRKNLCATQALAVISFLMAAGPLLAETISVVNPSFEANLLADGSSTSSASGWNTTAGGGDGTLNPTVVQYPSGIPQGLNVAFVNSSGNVVKQTLSATLLADRLYTLRVAVGRRTDSSFAGYRVQLRAGGVVLAEDNSSQTPAAGAFVPVTVRYRSSSSDAQLGQALEIHLLSPNPQANFDDVHLDVSRACLERPPTMTAWWPLDEPGPANAADMIGANDGAHLGGPTPIAGKVAGALRFDGVNDYVQMTDHPSLDVGLGDFSVDAWIRTDSSAGVVTMLDKRTSGAGGPLGYSLFLASGNLGFQLADGGGSATCSTNPATSACTNYVAPAFVGDGLWHHVAVTVERASSTGLIFYLDGASVGSYDPTVRSGTLDNAGPLRLGSYSLGLSSFFPGDLDEVELFKRALTPQEVADLYAVGMNGKCKERISMNWDVPVCLGSNLSRPTSIEICNDSPVDRDYELTFLPVPQGACGIDGPDAFFLLGPPVVAVPPAVAVSIAARSCQALPFEIERPVQMTQGGLIGCFDAVLTEQVSGEQIWQRGSVQDWRECCSSGPTNPVTELGPNGNATVLFSVVNTSGATLSFDYRVEAMPPAFGPPGSLLSLNGATPGVPVTGSVSFDDQEVVDITLQASFGEEIGLLTEDLILLVDTGDGNFQALASTRVRAKLATEVFDDGFESGDLGAWTSAAPVP